MLQELAFCSLPLVVAREALAQYNHAGARVLLCCCQGFDDEDDEESSIHPVLDMEIVQVRQKFGHNSIDNRLDVRSLIGQISGVTLDQWCHTGSVVSHRLINFELRQNQSVAKKYLVYSQKNSITHWQFFLLYNKLHTPSNPEFMLELTKWTCSSRQT